MELWSHIFLEERDWATCCVTLPKWRQITEEYPGSRIFAEITDNDTKVFVALGTPHSENNFDNKIYLPNWFLDKLGMDGCGESAEVKWLSQEHFPQATRIVLRPHDSAFYHVDAKKELEPALTRIGVIQEGHEIIVPLESLGGYEITFDIVKTEPANIVLAEGDEVVMEFEEALDAQKSEESVPEPFTSTNTNTNVHTPLPTGGHILGGEIRFMPDGTRWNPWKHGPWVKDVPHK